MGVMATITQTIDHDTAALVVENGGPARVFVNRLDRPAQAEGRPTPRPANAGRVYIARTRAASWAGSSRAAFRPT